MEKYRIKRFSASGYITVNGVSYYGPCWTSSCPDAESFRRSSKTTYNLEAFRRAVLKGKMNSPFNSRPLRTTDYIVFSDKEISREINFHISKDQKLLGFFEESRNSNLSAIILSVLTKYKQSNPNSTWEFHSFLDDLNKRYCTVISAPKRPQEYHTLSEVFTEISEAIRVFCGYRCKIAIVINKGKRLKQKNYSLVIPGVILGKIVLNKVSVSLVKSLTSGNKYSEDTENKLLSWANGRGDLMVINLGNSSFYVSRSHYENDKSAYRSLMGRGDSDDPRTITDYLKLAVSEGKDLIVHSDAASTVVLAHELGHYIVSGKKFLRRLQNGQFWRSLSRSDRFISFIGILLGLTGNVVSGVLSAIMMKSPELITEFAASYYGLKLMKDLGCSKEDIKKARSDFKKAFLTYLNNALGLSLTSIAAGELGKVLDIPEQMPDIL